MELDELYSRIDSLTKDHKPKFGKMNAHQMICHVTDQLRIALGTKTDVEHGGMDPDEVVRRSLAGEFVPTPKGMGQVEGDGTIPKDFENDREQLKSHLKSLIDWDEEEGLFAHPYLGKLDKKGWMRVTRFHLNHHLKQFGA
jgi:hypothetical protein